MEVVFVVWEAMLCGNRAWVLCRSSPGSGRSELELEPVDVHVLNAAVRDIQVSDSVLQWVGLLFD